MDVTYVVVLPEKENAGPHIFAKLVVDMCTEYANRKRKGKITLLYLSFLFVVIEIASMVQVSTNQTACSGAPEMPERTSPNDSASGIGTGRCIRACMYCPKDQCGLFL
jgi:hypothetical protein